MDEHGEFIIELQQDILQLIEDGEIAAVYDTDGEVYFFHTGVCSGDVMDARLTVNQYVNLMEPAASGRRVELN